MGTAANSVEVFDHGSVGVLARDAEHSTPTVPVELLELQATMRATRAIDACPPTGRTKNAGCPFLDFTSHEELPDPCAICLDTMSVGQRVARLACGHCFHRRCIENWATTSLTCPLCKRSLTRLTSAIVPDFNAWTPLA